MTEQSSVTFSPKGGFCFISTVLDMQLQLPIQITPALKLERASDAQIQIIKPCLEENLGTMRISHSDRYEFQCTEIKEDNCTRYERTPLATEDWRYYILTFVGNNYQSHQFFYIADLVFPHIISFASYLTSEEFGQGNIMGAGSDK